MNELKVVNIKCGGCAEKITEKLKSIGLSNIKVSPEKQTVSFDGDNVDAAKKALDKLGYPLAGTKEAAKLSKKAKSYISCAVGRWG